MAQPIGSLLDSTMNRDWLNQQSQVKHLESYLATAFPQIKTVISSGPQRITIRAENAADACRLKLDWSNIVKHCRPEQKLIIKVGGDQA